MTPRDDLLDGSLRQLREASNPSADQRARVLAAVQRPARLPTAPATERARLPGTTPQGARPSTLARPSFVGRVIFGLAAFGIGVGVGVGVGFGLGRSLVRVDERSAERELAMGHTLLLEVPAQPVVAATRRSPLASSEPAVSLAPPPLVTPRLEAPPRAVQAQRPKPRSRANARAPSPPSPPSPLGLAEALQLLHRAERAIYSNNAAWAVSLLDDLDLRAPPALLREERVATRILAWCADGHVERAERLASQARKEAPSSIYADILERPCATGGSASSQRTTREDSTTRSE